MRILHFLLGRCSPDSANGVDKTAYYLSYYQAQMGNTVGIFSLSSKEDLPIPGVFVKNFPPNKFPFSLPAELFESLDKWKADFVHLHSAFIPQNIILAKYLNRKGIPYLITPNGALSPYLLRNSWYFKIPFRGFLEIPYFNKAKLVHAVSNKEVQDLRKNEIKTQAVVAPNGIDIHTIPADLNPNYLLQKYPFLKDKKIFLFLGRLNIVQKGLDLLIKGFYHAKTDLKDSALVLVGPDWKGSRAKINRWIEQYGLEESVYPIGPAYGKEKFDIIASSDVFVHTSRWEGLPFAVLEALACGKPCLLTEATNLGDYLVNYNAGYLVKNEPGDIAEKLSRLGNMNDKEINLLGNNAKDLAFKEFDWKTIAGNLTDSIKSLM